MSIPPHVLADERLRELAPADQNEVIDAVARGRAVSDPRLAPVAIAYAVRWHRCGGPRLYRSWWYLGVAAILVSIGYATASWQAAALVASAFLLCPQVSRMRMARARRAELRNRELLYMRGHRLRDPSSSTASTR